MSERYGIKENQARAFNKSIKTSPQKLGLVIDLVRGLPAARAVDVLKFSKKRAAGDVLKTLLSAVANAEHNKKLPVDSLFVREIWCGKSMVMKRMMPGPKGGAKPILKPFSNLTIIVESGAGKSPVASRQSPVKEFGKEKTEKKETKKKK